MFPGTARRALFATIVALTGAAILPGGTAAADQSQDDKFFELLGEKDIPAIDNADSLIDTGHKVCAKLDGGMSVDDLRELIRNNGFNENPLARLYPAARVSRTINRFIAAAVEAYCPYDQSKIAPAAAHLPAGSSDPPYRVAAYAHNVVNAPAASGETTGSDAVGLPVLLYSRVFLARNDRSDRSERDADGLMLASLIGTVPSGEIPPTKPPPIPAQPPPVPQQVAPAPQQPPPPPRHVQPVPQQAPPQQSEPAPQAEPPQQAEPAPQEEPPPQAEPPAEAPPPGGGNTGGDVPPPPPPPPPPPAPKPPGHIQLAP